MTIVVRAALFALGGCACLASLGVAQQQPTTLTGHVTSATGAPLSQATVFVQELNAGTSTRADGSYTLAIPGARVPAAAAAATARVLRENKDAPGPGHVPCLGGDVRYPSTDTSPPRGRTPCPTSPPDCVMR
jgi:hypothetical protein